MLEDGGRRIRFDRIPVFAEHITVPPHVAVTTASHKYSFTESETDLCFHLPEVLPDGSMDLTTFLGKASAEFLDGGEKLSPDGPDQMLGELIAGVYGDQGTAAPTFRTEGEDPIGRWFSWGDHLRSEYEIEQFAFVRWENEAGLF
ncbi:hypothetical protein [Aquisediminimonas sediminicola]|uniref:hypothetical protein n=1 Tax=Alteraquisediminimonas sediminicola TaxID=2676787 RepID=UPI001C8D6BB1|nr:hypothetical protein [Aquisediminimonas sediminicola]